VLQDSTAAKFFDEEALVFFVCEEFGIVFLSVATDDQPPDEPKHLLCVGEGLEEVAAVKFWDAGGCAWVGVDGHGVRVCCGRGCESQPLPGGGKGHWEAAAWALRLRRRKPNHSDEVMAVPGSEACVPRCWPGACLFFAVESARSWEVERCRNGADSGLAAPRRRAKSRAIRMIIAEYLCV